MSQAAQLFINGRSQAVRLPVAYRFDAKEVFIRRDAETGDIRSIAALLDVHRPCCHAGRRQAVT